MKRKQKLTIVILAVLLVLVVTLSLLGKFVWGWFDKQSAPRILPDLEAGEAYYYMGGNPVSGVVLLFPQKERADISMVRVHNRRDEHYFFYHNVSWGQNWFALGQADGTWEGESTLYSPPIMENWNGTFDYTSLYDDTTTIPAMLAAVGTVNIAERIRPETGVDFSRFLRRFGLGEEDNPAYFEIISYYRDSAGNYLYTPEGDTDSVIAVDPADGTYRYIDPATMTLGEAYTGDRAALTPVPDTEHTLRVYVGNRTVDDNGYYLYLEGRDVVYTTTNRYLTDVVERGIGYYVYPRLVSQAESRYANQLTPDLSLWRGLTVSEGATLTEEMTANLLATIRRYDSDAGVDRTEDDTFLQVDLSEATRLAKALLGRTVGGGGFDLLVPTANLWDGMPGAAVRYRILGVSGILRGGVYGQDAALSAEAGDCVTVRYTDGITRETDGSYRVWEGYADLSDPAMPDALRAAIIGRHPGDYLAPEAAPEVVCRYPTGDTNSHRMRLEILSVNRILSPEGTAQEQVTYGSTVRFSYRLTEYDEAGNEVTGRVYTTTLTLPTEAQFDDRDAWENELQYANAERQMYTLQAVFRALIGVGVGRYTNGDGGSTLPATDLYYPIEILSSFTLYRNVRAESAIRYEQTLRIGYTNDRDAYFGSSLYRILAPDDKRMYGLDAAATQQVMALFYNLIGDETVRVGLGADVIEQYGLWKNRVYYELPFGIYSAEEGDRTRYYSRYRIGYTLYISDIQPDGSRYVGSDQYDIVVRVADGSTLDFVDWEFKTGWVQNNLLMVGYEDLRRMVFDIRYEDYQHVWGIDVAVDRDYYYKSSFTEGGQTQTQYTKLARLWAALVDGEGFSGNTYADYLRLFEYRTETDTSDYGGYDVWDPRLPHAGAGLFVRKVSDSFHILTRLVNEKQIDLDKLYANTGHQGMPNTRDEWGAYSVKTILQMLNATHYAGEAEEDLTQEEIDAIVAQDKNRVLTIALTLDNGEGESGYVLRFYAYSSHALVSVSSVDEAGGETASALFYVQAREVARIAEAVISLSRGETIDGDAY